MCFAPPLPRIRISWHGSNIEALDLPLQLQSAKERLNDIQKHSKPFALSPFFCSPKGRFTSKRPCNMVRQSYRPLVEESPRSVHLQLRARTRENDESSDEQRLGIARRSNATGRQPLFGDFSLRSSRRSGPNRRVNASQQKLVTATISNKRAVSQGRPGMYERGLKFQAIRDAKVEKLRRKMMEECTFTPKTSQSSSSMSRTTATNASSEPKSMLDDVYQRLYSHPAGSFRTPQKARSKTGSSTFHTTPNSTTSRSGSACSSRIEELYQEGKYKLRRRLTEEQEKSLRERRREYQDVLECTFRPKTKWNTSDVVKKASRDPGRIGISPRKLDYTTPPPKRKTLNLPQEILVTSPSDIRHFTPPRNRTTTADCSMVSPLYDPSVYEDTTSIDDSNLIPRMQCISIVTAGTSTAASCSQQPPKDEETEYGSI